MGRRRTQQTGGNGLQQQDDHREEVAGTLFDGNDTIDHIYVERIDPAEGFLGRIPWPCPSLEEEIRGRYGGGKFKLRACDEASAFCKGVPIRNIPIGGEPIWQSQTAERRWRRQQGEPLELPGSTRSPAAPPPERALSIGELMLLLDKQAERARADIAAGAEARRREQEEGHARQLELLREDARRREKELEAERLRLDREAQERAERQRADLAAERERQREHMQLMLQLVKEKAGAASESSPVSTLMQGIKLAMEMRPPSEGGAVDPLTALATSFPEILAEAGKLAAIDKVGASRAQAKDEDGEGVKLVGTVGVAAQKLIQHLKEAGKDPAAEMAKIFEVIRRGRVAAATPNPRKPARTPPAKAPAKKPPPRPTSRPAKSRPRAAAR